MNSKNQIFEQFLTNARVQIPITDFAINLLLAALLAIVLSYVYVRFGRSLSNRKAFARNFILLTMTTMLIISIVKSSLALSLGLVGALSIVRFRAAIKEPEELTYLFLAIAVGLGLGAGQRLITLVALTIIIATVILKNVTSRGEENRNLLLTVSSNPAKDVDLARVIETLRKHCSAANLKRFDRSREAFEASFLVEFEDVSQLGASKDALRKLSDSIKISFLDNSGEF